MAYITYLHNFYPRKYNGKLNDILVESIKSKIKVEEAKNSYGNYPFFTSGSTILKWHEYVTKGRNCFLNTGGNADVKFYVGKASYSTDTWCICGKNNTSDYLYLLLFSIKLEINKKFFQGTGLKHLQKSLLKNRPIYIPSKLEIKYFNKQIIPIFNMITKKMEENQRLEQLSNLILRKLMNGHAEICD